MTALSSGSSNSMLGCFTGTNINIGYNNTGIGYSSLRYLKGGVNNTCLGFDSGYSYTGTETNNVLLSSTGFVGDNNTIRVGTTQTQNYQVGIFNVIPANQSYRLMIDQSNKITSMPCALAEVTFENSTTILIHTDTGAAVEINPSTNLLTTNGMFDNPAPGRIRYIGATTSFISISYCLSIKLNIGTTYDTCLLQIRKNGAVQPGAGVLVMLNTNELDWNSCGGNKIISMAQNDYISIFITDQNTASLHNADLYSMVITANF